MTIKEVKTEITDCIETLDSNKKNYPKMRTIDVIDLFKKLQKQIESIDK